MYDFRPYQTCTNRRKVQNKQRLPYIRSFAKYSFGGMASNKVKLNVERKTSSNVRIDLYGMRLKKPLLFTVVLIL